MRLRRASWIVGPVASLLAFAATAAVLDRGLVLPGGPPPPVSPDEAGAIVGAVADFHRVYQDFFTSGGETALLDACPATPSVKHLVFTDVGFLRESGLVLVQDLAEATVMDVQRTGPDSAEVLVYEEWNYAYRKIADRAVGAEPKGLGQGFRYTVRRATDRWLVAGWVTEDVERPHDGATFKW